MAKPSAVQTLADAVYRFTGLPDDDAGAVRAVLSERLSSQLGEPFAWLHAYDQEALALAIRDAIAACSRNGSQSRPAAADPVQVYDRFRQYPDMDRLHLSDVAQDSYEPVLRQCARSAVELMWTADDCGVRQPDRMPLEQLAEALARLPRHDLGVADGQDYLMTLTRVLTRGHPLRPDAKRCMPPAVAEISPDPSQPLNPYVRLPAILGNRRILLCGRPGSGKTTFLHWLALGNAEPDSASVPFVVPLRRYSNDPLPTVDELADFVGGHVSRSLPTGWVARQLRDGFGLLLIDGVDELPSPRRNEFLSWVWDLIAAFPRSRFVVTSRHSDGVEELAAEGFHAVELQPLSDIDVADHQRLWDAEPQTDIPTHQRTPLAVALTCFLARAGIPSPPQQSDLVARVIHLALGIEGTAHQRHGELPPVLAALADLALELSTRRRFVFDDADLTRALIRRSALSPGEPWTATLSAVPGLQYIVASSSLSGYYEFVHRCFQDHLTALAIATKSMQTLSAVAHLPEWADTVREVAQLTGTETREAMLSSVSDRAGANDLRLLLNLGLPGDADAEHTQRVIAVGSVRERIGETVDAFASAASDVLHLLPEMPAADTDAAVFTIRVARAVGGDPGLEHLARYGEDTRWRVQSELVRSWPWFDLEKFASRVLAHVPIDALEIRDPAFVDVLHPLKSLKRLTVAVGESPRADAMPHSLHSLTIEVGQGILLDYLPWHGLSSITLHGTSGERPSVFGVPLASTDAPLLETVEIRSCLLSGTPFFRDLTLSRLDLIGTMALVDLLRLNQRQPPRELYIDDLSNLASVEFPDSWARTLVLLDLGTDRVTDLEPLTKLASLESLCLRHHERGPGWNLLPLARLPNLKHIRLPGVSEVDLRGLANRRRLTVEIPRDCVADGSDQLGEGSQVVRLASL